MTGPLDERVRDRIVAETRGNPLALLELPRGRTPAELAGGFGLDGEPALAGRIEARYQERLETLPEATRLLLLVAAAEPVGDPLLLWSAAAALGIDAGAGAPAADAGLIELGAQVRFHHPLVRSAVYGAAAPEDRRRVHRGARRRHRREADPTAAPGTARRRRPGSTRTSPPSSSARPPAPGARGGVAAAAAFHERAAELTPDPARRARRALVAAQCKHQAGAAEAALSLLAVAQAGPLDELDSARAQLLRAQIIFATTRGRDAPPLLLEAARRLEPLDATLARETYLDAFAAALSADRLVRGGDAREIAAAVLAAEWEPSARPCDLLLDGLALLATEGYAAGAPALKAALRAFREEAHLRGGGAALAVAGVPRRPRAGRRRGLGRAHRPPGRARPPDRRAVRAADRPGRPRPRRALLRPARLGDRAGRGGGRRGGGDRQPRRPARRHRAGQLARAGERGAGAGRGRAGRRRCSTARGSGSSPPTGATRSATTASAATTRRWPRPSGAPRTRAGSAPRCGCWPTSSRRPRGPASRSARPARSSGWRRSPRPTAPTGRSASSSVRARC